MKENYAQGCLTGIVSDIDGLMYCINLRIIIETTNENVAIRSGKAYLLGDSFVCNDIKKKIDLKPILIPIPESYKTLGELEGI